MRGIETKKTISTEPKKSSELDTSSRVKANKSPAHNPSLGSTSFKFDRKLDSKQQMQARRNNPNNTKVFSSSYRRDIIRGGIYKDTILDKLVNWLANKFKQFERYLLRGSDTAFQNLQNNNLQALKLRKPLTEIKPNTALGTKINDDNEEPEAFDRWVFDDSDQNKRNK